MNRREFLELAALPLAQQLDRQDLRRLPGAVIATDGRRLADVELIRDWTGSSCRSRIVNRGRSAARIKEVVLADIELHMPPTTSLYGEGFQMLTQTAGTLGAPVDLSQYTDPKHYRIPTSEGARAYYGLLTLTPPEGATTLCAFTSCAKFSGRFELYDSGSPKGLRYEYGAALRYEYEAAPRYKPAAEPALVAQALRPAVEFGGAHVAQPFRAASGGRRLTVVVDTEGLSLGPGETWVLEDLLVTSGSDRSRLLAEVAGRLAARHPPLKVQAPPTGWCSWYCFGPNVTAQQVRDNLDVIATSMPALRYVQIDDGYQSAMGDWLETGAAFGGNVRTVLADIRQRGFEPAIWVAPFVAEEKSELFRSHPDWFIRNADGAPLRSDRVTFGGWRRGPWYAIDGTHPEAQSHLEHVFRTMRTEWGCTYFKLDANFWGAMHGGQFHDARATRIEAYRRGMQAIIRGAGNSFLLGCNHPIWPSLGVIHGSRSSNDIKRTWDRIKTTGFQNLQRNWQNGRLWWNDPDAIVLASDLSDAECQFHATVIYASGGMVLSGDDLTKLPPARAAMLKKLLPPTGVAAAFDDASLRAGTVVLPGARMLCLLNWDDGPETRTVRVGTGTVTDFWTGESLTPRAGVLELAMGARSARLLRLS
jgi:alpha-galactosidase